MSDWMRDLADETPIAVTLLAVSALCAASAPASAQRLIASLSNHRVMVTSSFTGAELVLFGAIETADPAPRRLRHRRHHQRAAPGRDHVPQGSRWLGIWLNVNSREFDNVPSYLAVLANRELDAIANADTRRRLQIGIENIPLTQRAAVTIADAGRRRSVPARRFLSSEMRAEQAQRPGTG